MISPKVSRVSGLIVLLVSLQSLAQAQPTAQLSQVEQLATALVRAKTPKERELLLDERKELVTVDLSKALAKQGADLQTRDEIEQALDVFRLAQKVAERINDKLGVASALKSIGDVFQAQRKIPEALQAHEQSLALSEELHDKELMSRVLNSIGVDYRHQDKNEVALPYFERSLKIASEIRMRSIMAAALGNMAVVASYKGQYQLALDYIQRALNEHEAENNKLGMAIVLGNLGITQTSVGNLAAALDSFQRSMKLSESIGDTYGITMNQYNIGNVYLKKGDFVRSLEYYQKSLANGAGASALINMGELYFQQGDYAQALALTEKVLEEWKQPGYPRGVALANLARLHQTAANQSKALEYFQKALESYEAATFKLGVASSLRGMGNSYFLNHQDAQALDYFLRSLKLSEETGEPEQLADLLADISRYHLRQKDYKQALDFASRSAHFSRISGNLTSLGRAYLLVGQSYVGQHEIVKARNKFEEAIASIEDRRIRVAGGSEQKQRFMEGNVQAYHEMISLLISENKTSEALVFAERSKGRALLDVLQGEKIDLTKSMTPQETAEERRLNNELISLNAEIRAESQRTEQNQLRLTELRTQMEKTRLRHEAFRASLYASYPNLRTQRGDTDPPSVDAIFSLLADDKTAFLEYVVVKDRTYLFVLTKNAGSNGLKPSLEVYSIDIKEQDLAQRVENYRQKIAKADLDFRQPARELYDLLLKPAAAQLRNRASLVVVPDGSLWNLPFQALQSGVQRYLIENQSISYAPSFTVLKEILKSKKTNKPVTSSKLLAFGNPAVDAQTAQRVKAVMMDETLAALPEAEKQVTELAKFYGPKLSRVYTGKDAREDRAKRESPSFRVIQFATHGILNNINPMYSHLVLAQEPGTPKEDGLLEAWEVMSLNLKAELVVLAACETARGRVGYGEGMIGMSWAFFVAGSPTTVASQWKVESASTTELMLEFHRSLVRSRPAARVSKAKALQLAAVKLLKTPEYQHPFFWASFVLLGDGN